MDIVQILLIGFGILSAILIVTIGALFFISRRSQRVMQSLLDLMTHPERAQINDATRVLETILAGEIEKIAALFNNMRDTLDGQIVAANELKNQLGIQNEELVNTADGAVKKISTMSDRLENTVTGLQGVVESGAWGDVARITDNFSSTVNELLTKIDTTNQDTTNRTNDIRTAIDGWVETSNALSDKLKSEFESNDTQMQKLTADCDMMQQKLDELATHVADGFNNVKTSAADYDTVMKANDALLDSHLVKMETYSKKSKKQLTDQMNTLTNTANVVAGQIRLTESSIEKQIKKLTDAVDSSMTSATSTETSVRGITRELTDLTNTFNEHTREFTDNVVKEIKAVSGVANVTLENTKTAAGAFSESVRAMATGVRETLMEMNTAHTQLSGQSENLIKMSAETTAKLQPLSELIERYFAALPDLTRDSIATNEELAKIVDGMNKQIAAMKETVAESTAAISQSAISLDDLAGQSRQQMIDLMSDYAQAVDTMQTLNKQMMIARASAPMDAIGAAPAAAPKPFGHVSGADFLKQSERMFEKLHEQSLDLTQATGATIPDVVWKKYHDGDKTVFSKWLAKLMSAADKKQVREMLKSNTAFRNQATQFVRGFDKIMSGATQTDNPDKVTASLLKNDLGQVYNVLKPLI